MGAIAAVRMGESTPVRRRLADWSVGGSRTGVQEAHGLECRRLADWSAGGLRTGVQKAHGLECKRLADWSAADNSQNEAVK